ncbi:MAG: N-acetylmuramoyl-L-alanine amidase [Acidimicrobiales bacterium]
MLHSGQVEFVTVAPGLEIAPRSSWADAEPTGPLEAEAPGDVRFLLVHHTASTNDYEPADVVPQLRSFYAFHTGPEKGWPDIAYNFMVDRFGGVWEARAGSIDQPIKGSATGGSQGFALLCCLIGNHDEEAPTSAAVDSLSRLLGWLADRYGIALGPGETATFVSRGSNRWDAGVEVTTSTISGHREMSLTTCPGDHAFELIGRTIIPAAATAAGSAARATSTTEAATTTAAPTTTAEPTTTAAPTTTTSTTGPTVAATESESAAAPIDTTGGRSLGPLGAAGVLGLGAVGGLIAWRRRTGR